MSYIYMYMCVYTSRHIYIYAIHICYVQTALNLCCPSRWDVCVLGDLPLRHTDQGFLTLWCFWSSFSTKAR